MLSVLEFERVCVFTTVLEKQPKFCECQKNLDIIPSLCRNFLVCENRIGNSYSVLETFKGASHSNALWYAGMHYHVAIYHKRYAYGY